jgi:hypothetical protein
MSEWLTPLRIQLIDEIDYGNRAGGDGVRPSWRVLHPLRYQSDLLGKIIEVPTGFDTDFSSTPAGMQQQVFKASVLHDFCYRTQALSKDEADSVFLEAMLVDRIPSAHKFYLAVRLFGGSSYNPE